MKLNLDNIYELVRNNIYDIPQEKRFICRDFNGDYENNEKLPALAIPGADFGQLITLLSTANSYGFEIDIQKAFTALKTVIGEEDFIFDNAAELYKDFIQKYQNDLSVTEEDMQKLEDMINAASFNVSHFPSRKDVGAGAILIIDGNKGIYPRFQFQTNNGLLTGTVYVFHRYLADERNKSLAASLVNTDAVTLYEGCDEEYLYAAITETMDTHFFQIANTMLPNLPIYTVTFAASGTFDIEQA